MAGEGRKRRGEKPQRFHDRLGRPYALDKGEVLGAYGNVSRDRDPETIVPIKRRYSLNDAVVFDQALATLVANATVVAQVRAFYRNERALRRMTPETAANLLAAAVASLRGISDEEARALVDRRVAKLLHETEVGVVSSFGPVGRDGQDDARLAQVRSMRRHRRVT
jgi:hypothetical protein